LRHARLQLNVLAAATVAGALGAPLLAPVRETLQAEAGLSRAELGMWFFLLGFVGGFAGLVLGVAMRRTVRTTFFRASLFIRLIGCAMIALADPARGSGLAAIALAFFLLSVGKSMGATSNGIFADLWDHSPHTGVTVLHMTNSFGKVVAPLLVMAVGTALSRNALAYAAVFGVLAIEGLFWPARSVGELGLMERSRDVVRRWRLPREPLVWLAAVQFTFIAGAEAGAVGILGSLVARLRPCPFAWIDPVTWPAAAVAVMLCGIVGGRVLFTLLSRRLSERAIIAACLVCGLFAFPAAFAESAAVYLPALFLTGICFSATWPAFFGLAARAYPGERTFLSMGAGFFTAFGVPACIFLSSAIGNVEAHLPHAFCASAGVVALFAAFLFVTPWGRRLQEAAEANGRWPGGRLKPDEGDDRDRRETTTSERP
jgi:hypothetical protein